MSDTDRRPTPMRTGLCGRARGQRAPGWNCAGGWPAAATTASTSRSSTCETTPGLVQCVVDGAVDVRSEYVVRWPAPSAAAPRGRSTRSSRRARWSSRTARSRSWPWPSPRRCRSRTGSRPTRPSGSATATSTCAGTACRPTCGCGRPSTRRCAGPWSATASVRSRHPSCGRRRPRAPASSRVPSRLHHGTFYVLPQSPQLAKQLLMVAGMDRYYQIARCLRDEDPRADRQYEFTQLDLEASFVTQDDVMAIVGDAVADASEAVTGRRPTEIERITWAEALDRYGTDKPDLRFGMTLVDLSSVFGAPACGRSPPRGEGDRARRGRIARPGPHRRAGRAGQVLGAAGLAWFRVGAAGRAGLTARGPSLRRRARRPRLDDRRQGGRPGLVVAGRPPPGLHGPRHIADPARRDVGRGGPRSTTCGSSTSRCSMEWMPTGTSSPPTTRSPCRRRGSSPARHRAAPVRAEAYDLVLNGWELGSGSVRIHRSDIQRRVFDVLGLGAEEAEARFGFLLDAFRYGAPPHAGFAIGLDRLVAIFAGEESIREVIAFPKTQSGADPLTGRPKPLAEAALRISASGRRPRRERRATCSVRRPTGAGGTVAVGSPTAAPHPRRGRRPAHLVGAGAPLRALGRVGPADLGDPVGSARDRQDDARPGAGRVLGQGVRPAVGDGLGREGRAGRPGGRATAGSASRARAPCSSSTRSTGSTRPSKTCSCRRSRTAWWC